MNRPDIILDGLSISRLFNAAAGVNLIFLRRMNHRRCKNHVPDVWCRTSARGIAAGLRNGRHAERILVVDSGYIVQKETHAKLTAQDGIVDASSAMLRRNCGSR